MEKKYSNKDKTVPCQLDLFQPLDKNDDTSSCKSSLSFTAGATIIPIGVYKTRQQVEQFYEVVKKLTAHLD